MYDRYDMFAIFSTSKQKNIHQLSPLACKEVDICININLLPDAPKTMPPFLPLMSHPIHLPEDPDE